MVIKKGEETTPPASTAGWKDRAQTPPGVVRVDGGGGGDENSKRATKNGPDFKDQVRDAARRGPPAATADIMDLEEFPWDEIHEDPATRPGAARVMVHDPRDDDRNSKRKVPDFKDQMRDATGGRSSPARDMPPQAPRFNSQASDAAPASSSAAAGRREDHPNRVTQQPGSHQEPMMQPQNAAVSHASSNTGDSIALISARVVTEPDDDDERLALQQRLVQAEQRLALVDNRPIVSAVPMSRFGDEETPGRTGEADSSVVSGTTPRLRPGLRRLLESRWGKAFLIIGVPVLVVVGVVVGVVIGVGNKGGDHETTSPTPFQPPFCLNSTCWVQLGDDITGTEVGDEFGWPLSLVAGGTRLASSAWLNDFNGIDAGLVRVFDIDSNGTAEQVGVDLYGESTDDIARGVLSEDGKRLAIGAPRNGGPNGTSSWSGQVRVFELQSGSWTQLGDSLYGETEEDYFGRFPALSSTGSIMACGAQWHSGIAGPWNGHVQVFQYTGSAWVRLGGDGDLEGVASDDGFGFTVSLSEDGTLLAVGAPYHDSNGESSGHVGVFQYSSGNWTQLGGGYINGSAAGDEFGYRVDLSMDGNILAVAAPFSNGNGPSSGQVRVFSYDENSDTWHPFGDDIYGDESHDSLTTISLSGNGMRLATGAPYADGDRGYARVYENLDGHWQPVGGKIWGYRTSESFGMGIALSSDGSRLAVSGSSWTVVPPRNGVVRLYELRDLY